jgi:curved DNA-binding protein CbpA
MPTLYQLLSLNRTASDNDIKKAYKQAALIYRPDQTHALPQDERDRREQLFTEVKNAYDILSDQEKRQKYDATHLGRPLENRKKFVVLRDDTNILPATAKPTVTVGSAGANISTTLAANNGTISLVSTMSDIKPE